MIFVYFNELKNFEIDIIKFEREKIILKIDLKKFVRRRNAILTKIFENSKIDVIMKKTFDEKKNIKKKVLNDANEQSTNENICYFR